MDYDIDTNPTEGFTTRWADRDAYVHKASLVHTVHEIAAARRWAWDQGAQRELWFERVETVKEDKHGNMVKVIEWAAELEVWGNYELTDGDLIHGWDMKRSDVATLDVAPNPDWIGKVQGDGTSGDMVTIVSANKPPILYTRKWWCCVLPDEAAFRSLRDEIRTGEAWNALLNATRQEPRLSNSLPAEDQHILRHLVEHHNLNPSQALAVRQCLDEGAVVSSMTGGAGTGKSETLVACIKAVMWQQGHFDPCIPNPKAPESIHTGRKGGGGANRQPPSGMHLRHGPNKRTGRQPDAAGDPIGRPGSCLLKGGLAGPPRALDAAPSCKGPDPPRFGAVQPSNSPRDVGRSSGLQWHIAVCPQQLPGALCNSWYGRHTAEVVATG